MKCLARLDARPRLGGEVLRVAVPAAFTKTWLEQKLAG